MKESQTPGDNPQTNLTQDALVSKGRIGAWNLGFIWSLVLGPWSFVPRGLALFLGGFSLLNVLGELRSPGFNANLWWVDLRSFPHILASAFLLIFAVSLIGYGLQAPRALWRRALTVACSGVLGIACIANTMKFYMLLGRGAVGTGMAIPLSLFVSAALAIILIASLRESVPSTGPTRLLQAIAVCVACLAAFPIAQMFCFGKTDYRRPADIAVVMGARVYADGRPSDALADRVRTACQLYHDGLTRKLLFSGGPGDGTIHETESMKRMAMRLGVDADDILVDEAGLNTQATVKNSEAIFSQMHASRIMVVSHFYHLPRIKMAYQRDGWDVYTVPAREKYLLRQLPYNMLREVAALWVYYLRPLSGSHVAGA
jgi:vancomycin permeability regulator SanA